LKLKNEVFDILRLAAIECDSIFCVDGDLLPQIRVFDEIGLIEKRQDI
jgi:diadenosine tetraphosphatase ApaH/serine/threonine PP2A family protein phosphatase